MTAKAMPKIKPCPFCGEKAVWDEFSEVVWCEGCQAFGPTAVTKRAAIENWNNCMTDGQRGPFRLEKENDK